MFTGRLLIVLLAARVVIAAEVRDVTIGIIVPPSEPNAASFERGAELAVAEANEAGPGRVRLEVRRQDGQWGTTGNEAVALACNVRADAIITPSDGAAAHLILQVAGRTRVPVACLCADTSVTEAGIPWAIRVVPRADQQMSTLLSGAGMPSGHWWAVIPAGRAGRAVRRDLEAATRGAAVTVDRIVALDEANPDCGAVARAAVATAPAGVLVWQSPERAGVLAAALRAAGFRGTLAGPSALDSAAFITAAGTAADGFLTVGFEANAEARSRADRFERHFRQIYAADADFSAAAAHDAAGVLIAILRRSANGYRQFPISSAWLGVTGVLHFDGTGNRTDPLQVLTYRRGRWVPLGSSDS